MNNVDLEHTLSLSAHTESSSNSEGDVPVTAQQIDHDITEHQGVSKLDQQVDAAVRDVETWLQDNSEGTKVRHTSEPKIDWSTPNLVEPVAVRPAETDEQLEPSYEEPSVSLDEQRIRESVRETERRMLEVAKARQQLQSKVLVKLETEAKLQAESVARRREEDELRRQADEEVARRRQDDDLKLEAQRSEIRRTERDLKGVWEEERRLTSEVVKLNQAAHEALLNRVRDEENAKLALLAEAQRSRDAAEETHIDNLARLHSEEESLRRAVARFGLRRTEVEAQRQRHEEESRKLEEERNRLASAEFARLAERKRIREEAEEKLRLDRELMSAQESELARLTESLALQRAELERARQSAEEDARRLAEARARMQEAQEASQQAERERLLLEAEIFQRAETERRMLEESRARIEEQHRLLEANARVRIEWQANRISELTALRLEAEQKVQAHTEREQILNNELVALRDDEQAVLARIEEIESQSRAASTSHNRLVEKLRRVEEEASARSTHEAQTRFEIERRIKEETEHLKRLENELTQRIEEEISRREEAEARLSKERNRYAIEHEARIKAELRVDLGSSVAATQENAVETNSREVDDNSLIDLSPPTEVERDLKSDGTFPVYQVGDLSSSDPRRRADAVIALARLGTQDAYDLIADCFDDESSLVRNAAARALLSLEPIRPAESFTRALKDATPERRVRIGKAIAESGLATQALKGLCSEDREETYNSLCLLFTMARSGEVQPLVSAIEGHEDAEVRVAAIRLLKMSGQEELATAAVNRRLQPNRNDAF